MVEACEYAWKLCLCKASSFECSGWLRPRSCKKMCILHVPSLGHMTALALDRLSHVWTCDVVLRHNHVINFNCSCLCGRGTGTLLCEARHATAPDFGSRLGFVSGLAPSSFKEAKLVSFKPLRARVAVPV
jgi:hypothetical protein